MLKPILMTTALIFSINTYAGCNRMDVSGEDSLGIPYTATVKELRQMKKDLNAYKEEVNYNYYYTLTHNRIYKKSFAITTENKLNELRETYKNNPDKLAELNQKETAFNQNLNNSLVKINKKTKELKELKLKEIDNKIEEINAIIDQKAGFPKFITN
jgi:flagellar hook-basal body complex protein FliE